MMKSFSSLGLCLSVNIFNLTPTKLLRLLNILRILSLLSESSSIKLLTPPSIVHQTQNFLVPCPDCTSKSLKVFNHLIMLSQNSYSMPSMNLYIPIRLSEIEFCLIAFNPELQIFHTFPDDDVLDPQVDCVE
ncbi:hypothetical protein Tco_0733164 [Tanacetum coccineum]